MSEMKPKTAAHQDDWYYGDQTAGGEVSGCELPTQVTKLRKFVAGWWSYDTPGQGIGNTVEMPWSVFECVEWMANNWHPAPATELAELRAEVERLKFDANCAEERAHKRGFLNVASPTANYEQALQNAEAKIATLTAQLAAAEREREFVQKVAEATRQRDEAYANRLNGETANRLLLDAIERAYYQLKNPEPPTAAPRQE